MMCILNIPLDPTVTSLQLIYYDLGGLKIPGAWLSRISSRTTERDDGRGLLLGQCPIPLLYTPYDPHFVSCILPYSDHLVCAQLFGLVGSKQLLLAI